MSNPLKSTSSRRAIRILIPLVILAVLGTGLWFWSQRGKDVGSGYRTAIVERGEIRVAISATGTLSALSTVDVGSEISGKVAEVLVDFNDRVRKGQVIARIDPSTFDAQIAQGDAAVANARASLATAQATLRNAELDYARKALLVEQRLIARSDADQARAARDQARAQIAAAQAQIAQQQASTQTARLNLGRTVIRSPVDGVVLTRSIEPGQTVAASLQAPVLFQIAEDLSKMEILLAIDEADVGQVKIGQDVGFTVDAFPDRRFRGRVQQLRLSATNTNNVITYPVVVAVDNADQALLPGMTANAEIAVSQRENVLKVPNAALRFKPPDETAAGAAQRSASGRGAAGLSEELPRIAQSLRLDVRQQAAFDDAMARMRERMAARAAPSANSSNGGSPLFGRGFGGASGGASRGDAAADGAIRQRMLERLNQQFAAFRATLHDAQRQRWDSGINALAAARRAPLYALVDGKPQMIMVRVGASDGSSTEIVGELREGERVIVGSERATASR